MSTLEVNKLVPLADNGTITLGDSGDTFDVPSGATLDVTGATVSGLSTGKIGQVVETRYSTKFATTSTSYVDTTSVTITPTATSSKVLVFLSGMFGAGANNSDNKFQIQRGNVTITDQEQLIRISDTNVNISYVTMLLDTPNTTSATTYNLQIKAEANEVFINRNGSNHQCGFTTFTAMEVLA